MTFKDKYGDHFGKTYKGNLDICGETLTSLEGCYSKVSGNFNCSENQLITLKYAPKDIGGAFVCFCNKISSYDYLFSSNIIGELISDFDSKKFKEDQKLFIKVGKNLSKYKKFKELLKLLKYKEIK